MDAKKEYKPVPDVDCLKYHGTPDKPDIKIFVSHRIDQDSETIDNPLYIPVRCGAIYDEREGVTMLGDDTGDSISERRLSFCEYTVMYWAWKNINADYYGLCHYRRYISFGEKDIAGNALRQGLLDSMADVNLNQCRLLDEEYISDTIKKEKCIVPYEYHMIDDAIPTSKCKNIREQWETFYSSFLQSKHFDYLISLIKKHSPYMLNDALEYMNGVHFRGFNCFIMSKQIFYQLCEFIFPILFEFDDNISKEHFSSTQNRAVGYAGEWLFSIFIYHLQKDKICPVKERQIVAFQSTEKAFDIKPILGGDAVPVIFTLNDFNRPHVSITFQSILANISDKRYYDFIFLQRSYDENKWGTYLRKSENALLKQMAADKKNVSVRFYDPKDYIGKTELHFFDKPSTEEQYYTIYLPWIFKYYKKALFVRETLLFTTDVAKLFDEDLDANYVGVLKDPIFSAMLNGYAPGFLKKANKLGLEDLYDYFATDFLLLNFDLIRKEVSIKKVHGLVQSKKWEGLSNDILNVLYEKKAKFLSYKWGKIECLDPNYFRLQEFIPEDISRKLSAIDDPFGYILRGTQGFAVPIQTYIGRLFWTYAKDTPFYEQLIFQTIPNYEPQIFDLQCRMGLFDTRTPIRKFADKLLPHGSRRRAFAKWLLPKGSLRWRFLKQIYYIFRPQYRPAKIKDEVIDDIEDEAEDIIYTELESESLTQASEEKETAEIK